MSVVVEYLEAPLSDAVAEERDDRAAVIVHRRVLCLEFFDYLHDVSPLIWQVSHEFIHCCLSAVSVGLVPRGEISTSILYNKHRKHIE